MAFKQGENAPLIITIGAVSGFLLLVIVIGLQAWFMSEEQDEMDRKYAGAVNFQLADLRAEQQTKLNTYRWVDRDKQVVAIPIDDAMKLLMQTNGKLPATQPNK